MRHEVAGSPLCSSGFLAIPMFFPMKCFSRENQKQLKTRYQPATTRYRTARSIPARCTCAGQENGQRHLVIADRLAIGPRLVSVWLAAAFSLAFSRLL